jgi:prepilin-type N-terminal cleavage/methylation domain-containing protein
MRRSANHQARGFTLIEIIVTLVIVAVAGTMLYTYFGKTFLESVNPVLRLQQSTSLQSVMANIAADYKKYPGWKAGHTYQVNDVVLPSPYSSIGQRFYYKCTTAGTSGSSEPIWTGNQNDAITDNTITWECQGALLTLSAFKNKIGASDSANKKYDYGHCGSTCTSNSDCLSGSICDGECKYGYYVIENKYIAFDASNIEYDVTSGDILKVTIRNDNGETLSALFN